LNAVTGLQGVRRQHGLWDYDRTWEVVFLHKECNNRMTAAL
jgi:hypothetical protein